MAPERWLPWEDGGYEVSSRGRVRRCVGIYAGRILSQHCRAGIAYVCFQEGHGENRASVRYRVAYLVACLFVRRPHRGEYVRHRDGDRWNCEASNLYWGEREPSPSRLARIRRGENHYSAKLTEKIVLAARKRWRRGVSATALAAEYGVSRDTMYCAVSGKNWKHLRP